jgi:hypothetical protein
VQAVEVAEELVEEEALKIVLWRILVSMPPCLESTRLVR